MQSFSHPYPHLIAENWMSSDDFERCKQSISFDEMKNYCDDPDVHEHGNATHGNYSMPCDLSKSASWLVDYFANQKNFQTITKQLYGKELEPDHSYINLHWDSADTSLGIHNDQKKYRWLVTGQLYVQGNEKDGVILQDDNLNEITQVPFKANLFYAIKTSMFSWHHVKNIKEDKISILVRFGKKQINTVTNYDKMRDYAIIIHNADHYDGHYSKLGMRMANMTEAWLYDQGYYNIHMSEWKNPKSFDRLQEYCDSYYRKTIIVPSGYLGDRDLLSQHVRSTDVEKITEENIKEKADIVFNRDKYENSRFKEGEMILRSFDPISCFSKTREKLL